MLSKTANNGVTSTVARLTNLPKEGMMAERQIAQYQAQHQDNSNEVWKPVVTEEGILASSMGRVLLPPRYAPLPNGGYRAYFPKPRSGCVSRSKKEASHELLIIMVKRNSVKARQSPRKVHQLVCEAFHGPKPFENAVVIHINENALDNRPENLRWGTQKENLNMPKFKEYLKTSRRKKPAPDRH